MPLMIEMGTFNRLPHLRFLKLEGSNLQEFRERLDLTSLTFLSIAKNQLTHFPTNFPSTMIKIYLQNNKLAGEIKLESTAFPFINTLFLGGNDLTSLDLDLPTLQILDLERAINLDVLNQNLNVPALNSLDIGETIIPDLTLISRFPNLITLIMDDLPNNVVTPKSITKGTFVNNNKLEVIDLTSNVLDCCGLQGLTELSRKQAISISGKCQNAFRKLEFNLTTMLDIATTYYTAAQ
eukprot:Awhi_evm1s542